MRIAWIQDLHLKPYLLFRKRMLVGDANEALNQIAQICVQRQVSAIILGGDVYDSPRPEAYALQAFGAFVRGLRRKGVEVYDLQGNHDKTTEIEGLGPAPSLAGCQEVQSINGMLCGVDAARLDGGIQIYGLQYAPAATITEQLANVPECDILCMHARFQHMLGFDEAFNFTLEDIPPQVKWAVLCGDIHATDVTEYRKDRWFVSSGSIYPVKYGEHMRDHMVCILDTETRVPELVKLKHRKYLDIDGLADIQIADYIWQQDDRCSKDSRLRPVFITSLERPTMESQVPGDLFVPQPKVRDVGQEDPGLDDGGMTLEQAIAKHCATEPEVHQMLTDLVATGNPAQYMEEWLKLNT